MRSARPLPCVIVILRRSVDDNSPAVGAYHLFNRLWRAEDRHEGDSDRSVKALNGQHASGNDVSQQNAAVFGTFGARSSSESHRDVSRRVMQRVTGATSNA